MTRQEKRNIFILLATVFTLMLVGLIFKWEISNSIFGYLFVIIIFYPKKTLELIFPLGLLFSGLTVLFVLIGKNQWANELSLWLFYILVLVWWGLIVRIAKKR